MSGAMQLHMDLFVIKQCTRFFRSLVTSVSKYHSARPVLVLT